MLQKAVTRYQSRNRRDTSYVALRATTRRYVNVRTTKSQAMRPNVCCVELLLYGAPGRNTATHLKKLRHVLCQHADETSGECCSVLSRSKLQMVAASAARRQDKNELCPRHVRVVNVATRCSFVATQLVATRVAAVSRSLCVAAHVACALRSSNCYSSQETSGNTATRELNLVGQIPFSLIVECASTRPPEGLSLTS